MNAGRLGLAIALALFMAPLVWAKHKASNVTSVRMQDDPKHLMISVGCQIEGRRYRCVIDSGATHTIISDKVVKPEGPLVEVTTAGGVIKVHQKEVSVKLAEGLELKSKAFIQSSMKPDDVQILLGQDVLRQFRAVILDYEHQQVEFHR